MSSFGTVPLKEVWDMLAHCAQGYHAKQTTHFWCVYFGPISYPSLPLGKHGSRKNPEIEIGHIKQMARRFGILDCAKRFLNLK